MPGCNLHENYTPLIPDGFDSLGYGRQGRRVRGVLGVRVRPSCRTLSKKGKKLKKRRFFLSDSLTFHLFLPI